MSRRHAFLACVATFHGVDYLAHPRNPRRLRQKFNKQSPEFALVDRVAHAFKHVVSGNVSSLKRQPLKAAEVLARPPEFSDVAFCDLSRSDDLMGDVTLDQERDIDLLAVLKRAVAFLRTQLNQQQRMPMSRERRHAYRNAEPPRLRLSEEVSALVIAQTAAEPGLLRKSASVSANR